ncbi:MAG: hypothetical protein J2P48_03740 [Alphaproteobacteria bacterium]|nr:hypothetical protein [Alphaproteobacteria bacterium]
MFDGVPLDYGTPEDVSMTDRPELARAIVQDAARQYIASRRERIDAFVDRHFTFAGSLALHRRAIGWDLVRAPLNLFLAGPALIARLANWLAHRSGSQRAAAWLARRRLLLETDVAREVERLLATELLEIRCCGQGSAYRDAIAETILADSRTAERLGALIGALAGVKPESRRLAAAVENYLGLRTAAAEITTSVAAAGIGALAIKQATPGLVTLSSALAGMIAQQAAIAAFPLGAGLGALWYGLFPAAAGTGLLATTMGGVFVCAALLSAFSGILTDPLQRRLGLHRRRLLCLLDGLEAILCGEADRPMTMRDHYVARLVDLFDLVALALRASHA